MKALLVVAAAHLPVCAKLAATIYSLSSSALSLSQPMGSACCGHKYEIKKRARELCGLIA